MDKTTHQTLPCVCGRLPTVDYHRGMMLWRPSCANPACAVHAHSFPLFANESGAVAAQICGEIGEMVGREAACKQSVTNCNHLGNAAKMREALKRADAVLSLISKSAWFIDANFAETKAVIEAGNAIEAALSSPQRNCDRPECATAKEAQEMWSKEDGGKTAYYEWLLATYLHKGEHK